MIAIRKMFSATLLAIAWIPRIAAAAPDCAALDDPIYHRVNPSSQANLLTPWQSEADSAAANHGFTDDRGTPVLASRTPASGLVAAHRLYNGSSNDFVWITNPAEIAGAVANYGYADKGTDFYVSPEPASCTQPVHRFLKGNKHRHAFSDAERSALLAQGWTAEGVSFHAKPAAAPVDTTFSIAVLPDTQNEVFPGAPAARHVGRAQWLADNRQLLDLRFVLHTGDVTNWGERDEPQYQVAVSGVVPLENAGIAFAYTPGNHDTRAVCAGGSACPGESAIVNVRLLPLFNQYFGDRFAVTERMEPGKLDNYYTLFEAGGVGWMVLSLELWPRTAVVDWAKSAVAAHPAHNVIVVTHMYLDGDGSISTSNGGYGANSPRYLYDNLVGQYPNVRFVFSGHTGQAASRTDTGVHGNRIASFLQSFHSPTNPVRIVEIDTAADTAASWIYAPQTATEYPEYDVRVTDLDFVR
ncbi:metallophosphoesterase [Dokdonella ginsengisoli]|uniref:Metallophosphoesterase n=1 Tax=Dokdonella ginsengisoli TaxID=363846 RepID=A0ABV9QZM0_9GAMM